MQRKASTSAEIEASSLKARSHSANQISGLISPVPLEDDPAKDTSKSVSGADPIYNQKNKDGRQQQIQELAKQHLNWRSTLFSKLQQQQVWLTPDTKPKTH